VRFENRNRKTVYGSGGWGGAEAVRPGPISITSADGNVLIRIVRVRKSGEVMAWGH